jgi:prephenate dehydratase
MQASSRPQSQSEYAACFVLEADPTPCLLPRLLQPFARRGLILDHVSVRRSADRMRVELALDDITAEEAHLVEGNLRQLVGVFSLSRLAPARQRAA